MQLKKLESTLGAPLFRRGARSMTPTAAGERLLGHARRFLAAHEEALDAFRLPDLEGELRIGLNGDTGSVSLAQLFASFAQTHPRLRVSVRVAPTVELRPHLDAGDLDLAVIAPGGATPWRAEDRVIHEEPLAWIGAAGGGAWRRRPVPVAMAGRGCSWRAQAIEGLSKAGRAWREAYVSDADYANWAAAAADLAVSIAPVSTVDRAPELEVIGEEAGLPKLGLSRLALRVASAAAQDQAVQALAERVAAVYQDGYSAGYASGYAPSVSGPPTPSGR